MAWRNLTDEQWELIAECLPKRKPSRKGGRPRADDRACFEGILWVLWTGAPWSELPERYPSPSTCWRRLQEWEQSGVLIAMWRAFLGALDDMQKLRWDECFVDGSQLRSGEKRGSKVGKTKRGKGTKWMVLVDGCGTPLGAHLDSATPAEVKLLEATLDNVDVAGQDGPGMPQRLIGDRGYDSNVARAVLADRGIEPIIPARSNNHRATHQDGRKLRRYRRRWIVERTIAWLGWFRRLVVRYDRLSTSYAGFFHLACALLTLRRVLK